MMKTTKKSFNGNAEETVPGAGLSRKDLKQAIEFIETNTGNAEAFANNDIAYRNSIEIESNAAIWGGQCSTLRVEIMAKEVLALTITGNMAVILTATGSLE